MWEPIHFLKTQYFVEYIIIIIVIKLLLGTRSYECSTLADHSSLKLIQNNNV